MTTQDKAGFPTPGASDMTVPDFNDWSWFWSWKNGR